MVLQLAIYSSFLKIDSLQHPSGTEDIYKIYVDFWVKIIKKIIDDAQTIVYSALQLN